MITRTVYRGKRHNQPPGPESFSSFTWGTEIWLKSVKATPDGKEREVPAEQIDSNGQWHDPDEF